MREPSRVSKRAHGRAQPELTHRIAADRVRNRSLAPLVWKTVFSGQAFNDGVGSDLGGRVRELRRQRGLTLKALGGLAGLSHPFLSQVERGLARPSVTSVERIANALGVSPAQLWATPRPPESIQLQRAADAGPGPRRLLVGAAVVEEWSSAGRRFPKAHDAHPGEVLVYCARGALEIELGSSVHALEEGDSVVFDGLIPHRLRRLGSPRTRALIVRA
jgi:transcriptional regulator with XRE-family HTH domain